MPPWHAHLALHGHELANSQSLLCDPPPKSPPLPLPACALQHKPNPEFQGAVASGVPEQHAAHDELEDEQTHHGHRYPPPTGRQTLLCHPWLTLIDATPSCTPTPQSSSIPSLSTVLFPTFLYRRLFCPQPSIEEPSTSQPSKSLEHHAPHP
jgi:hypothetical protein